MTAKLINTLKGQHQLVVQFIGKIDGAIKANDTQEVVRQLGQMGTALLAHLELEDTELYPALIRAAEDSNQEKVATTAKLFSSNMGFISKSLKAFLVQYADAGAVEKDKFQADWRNVVSSLSARVRAEETTLYPMYERAMGAKQVRIAPLLLTTTKSEPVNRG